MIMCHEPAMKADILLGATFPTMTSKSPNMHSYTGLVTRNTKKRLGFFLTAVKHKRLV